MSYRTDRVQQRRLVEYGRSPFSNPVRSRSLHARSTLPYRRSRLDSLAESLLDALDQRRVADERRRRRVEAGGRSVEQRLGSVGRRAAGSLDHVRDRCRLVLVTELALWLRAQLWIAEETAPRQDLCDVGGERTAVSQLQLVAELVGDVRDRPGPVVVATTEPQDRRAVRRPPRARDTRRSVLLRPPRRSPSRSQRSPARTRPRRRRSRTA